MEESKHLCGPDCSLHRDLSSLSHTPHLTIAKAFTLLAAPWGLKQGLLPALYCMAPWLNCQRPFLFEQHFLGLSLPPIRHATEAHLNDLGADPTSPPPPICLPSYRKCTHPTPTYPGRQSTQVRPGLDPSSNGNSPSSHHINIYTPLPRVRSHI